MALIVALIVVLIVVLVGSLFVIREEVMLKILQCQRKGGRR